MTSFCKDGSIIRIKLTNFLAYDDCTFEFNPKLNVIAGPNGSGKSTVVNAIYIGLAGKVSLLKRGGSVTDFIKYGKSFAIIELELYGTENNYVIQRKINASSKTNSVWSLNKKPVSQKNVEKLVRKLNIDLENLCQFLSQDRVNEFARLNHVELLESTEKAICSPELIATRKWLCEYSKKTDLLESQKIGEKEKTEHLEMLLERYKPEVNRQMERINGMFMLEVMKLKRQWLTYKRKKKEFEDFGKTISDFKMKILEIKNQNEPLKTKLNDYKIKEAKLYKDSKIKVKQLKSEEAKLMKIKQQVQNLNEEICTYKGKLNQMSIRDDENKQAMSRIQVLVKSWKNELKEMKTVDVQPRIDSIFLDNEEIVKHLSLLSDKIAENYQKKKYLENDIKTLKKELSLLKDSKNRRLNILKCNKPDTFKAYNWLNENRRMFTGAIAGPLMLEIDVKEEKYAELLESRISKKDLFSFVCENMADSKKLIYEFRERRNLKVNVHIAPLSHSNKPVTADCFRPRQSIDSIKKYGFHHYLRDLFVASPLVMVLLCDNYRVHDLPVGSSITHSCIEQIKQRTSIKTFFIQLDNQSASYCYTFNKSRYTNEVSVCSYAVRAPYILNHNINNMKVAQKEEDINSKSTELISVDNEGKRLYQNQSKYQERKRQLQKELNKLYKEKNSHKILQKRIEENENQFTVLEKCKQESIAEQKETKKRLEEALVNKVAFCIQLHAKTNTIQNFQTVLGSIAVQTVAVQEVSQNVLSSVRALTNSQNEINSKIESLKEKKMSEKDLEKLYTELIEASKGKEGLDVMIKDNFGTLSDDIGKLAADILYSETILRDSRDANPSIFDDHLELERNLKAAKEKIKQIETTLEDNRVSMKDRKEEWLSSMQALISKIDEKFSSYFASMGCAGEVGLHSDQEDSFHTYGIKIRVKFRDLEDLRQLSVYWQSGGERSVTTMLYLVALQNISHCPFRLVDEINQGMDAKNEKYVFNVIADSSSQDTSNQYFLVTPKLIPDLDYNENMAIHMINYFSFRTSRIDIDYYLQQRSRIEYIEEE